jgi:hypothetical protein
MYIIHVIFYYFCGTYSITWCFVAFNLFLIMGDNTFITNTVLILINYNVNYKITHSFGLNNYLIIIL